ncbi:alpha/beta hydrolase [Myxococcota bacterium]|nr:alpha/beta hydrolase [Myxococcota bacterium]
MQESSVQSPQTKHWLVRSLIVTVGVYGALLLMITAIQRKLLFFPSHHTQTHALMPWKNGEEVIGFVRQRPAPKAIWLMMHGNAGQAADRVYAMPSFPAEDTVYLLEYPGYGQRKGSPSRTAFDQAAIEAYKLLRSTYPKHPICVVGESIGSGAASFLAAQSPPPDKITLVVPYDRLADVAARRLPFLPVRWLLRDDWDNIASLRDYRGPIEIFAAQRDEVIPFEHAQNLAKHLPRATFRPIAGYHNDWSWGAKVRFSAP